MLFIETAQRFPVFNIDVLTSFFGHPFNINITTVTIKLNTFYLIILFIYLIPVGLSKVTKCRRVFDRALRALPVTQHHRIWPLYVGWVKQHDIPETALRVYRR